MPPVSQPRANQGIVSIFKD